jgi:hypothetical protein
MQISIFFFFFFFKITMRLATTLYNKPLIFRPTLLLLRTYHSAEHSGGGLMGIDNLSAQPPTKRTIVDPPLNHLESSHINNPRSVRCLL